MKSVKISNNPTLLAAIVLFVIVVGIVGGAAYMLSSKSSDDTDSHNQSVSTASKQQSSPGQTDSQNSSDTSKPATPTPQANPTKPGTTTPPPAAAASGVTSIDITAAAFSPATVTVKKGTTITWTNKDTTDHAIAEADSLSGPHSPQLKPNDSYTYTYSTPGTYHYQCAINPALTGTVTVTN